MPYKRSLTTIDENDEELWTNDVEDALQTALIIFPAYQRMIKYNGKTYGRNKVISLYIEEKCGKFRTNNQIASHLQVLTMRQNRIKLSNFQKYLTKHNLIAPNSFKNNLLDLSENGAVKFLHLREDHNTERHFTDMMTFLLNAFDILAYRRISGEKLALLSIVLYVHEPSQYTQFVYSNTIFRGFTCITGSTIPEIRLAKIQHYFGQDLIDLYARAPRSAFYCAKTWNNMYLSSEPNSTYVWESIFYSKYLLNVKGWSKCYLMGQPFYGGFVEEEVDEVIFTGSQEKSDNYYIYKARCSLSPFVKNIYLKRLKKIVVGAGDVGILKTIMKNQSRIITLVDMDTEEVLLVLACINDYDPNLTGYQYFRIVP